MHRDVHMPCICITYSFFLQIPPGKWKAVPAVRQKERYKANKRIIRQGPEQMAVGGAQIVVGQMRRALADRPVVGPGGQLRSQ